MTFNLTLPYPPSANNYWRIFSIRGRPRIIVSKEARFYKDLIQRQGLQLKTKPLTGPLVIVLRIYRPQKRGDIDNAIKVLLDSLRGIAFMDDGQIEQLHAMRYDDKENPRVEVWIQQIMSANNQYQSLHLNSNTSAEKQS